MKKALFLTYLFSLFIMASAFSKDLPANVAYDDAEYESAAEQYLELLKDEPTSAELWYNLGNAYYKSGQIGYAVAAYRKAYKLSPTDEDIRFNLNFVFNKTADKIEPAPKNFIVRQTDIVADMFTSGGWAVLCIVFAALALGAFLLYIFMRTYSAKKWGLFTSVFFWGVAFFCLALSAHRYYYTLESAIVIVKPSADILAEPNGNGTRLLLLNEGATLQLKKREGDWIKVELPNGTVGYIQSKNVEII